MVVSREQRAWCSKRVESVAMGITVSAVVTYTCLFVCFACCLCVWHTSVDVNAVDLFNQSLLKEGKREFEKSFLLNLANNCRRPLCFNFVATLIDTFSPPVWIRTGGNPAIPTHITFKLANNTCEGGTDVSGSNAPRSNQKEAGSPAAVRIRVLINDDDHQSAGRNSWKLIVDAPDGGGRSACNAVLQAIEQV